MSAREIRSDMNKVPYPGAVWGVEVITEHVEHWEESLHDASDYGHQIGQNAEWIFTNSS